MKLVDIYLSYKKKYREYVVLIKSGIFYEVIEDDVGIMYSLFNYKIRQIIFISFLYYRIFYI